MAKPVGARPRQEVQKCQEDRSGVDDFAARHEVWRMWRRTTTPTARSSIAVALQTMSCARCQQPSSELGYADSSCSENASENAPNKVPEMQKVKYFEYPSVHDMASMHMVKSKNSDDCGTCTPA